jgi:hypothetical protein
MISPRASPKNHIFNVDEIGVRPDNNKTFQALLQIRRRKCQIKRRGRQSAACDKVRNEYVQSLPQAICRKIVTERNEMISNRTGYSQENPPECENWLQILTCLVAILILA